MAKNWVEAIAEREAQLGTPTIVRMAQIFVADSKAHLQTITAAVAKRTLATAARAARELVASAGALCFMQLQEVAQAFEDACTAGDQATASALHKDLAPLVEICTVQLRARYKLP